MGLNLSCCDTSRPVNSEGFVVTTDVSLVTKKKPRLQMAEGPPQSLKHVDPVIEMVLDDREVLGRIGKAKIQLIVKIQGLIRGAAIRRRIRLLNLSKVLQSAALNRGDSGLKSQIVSKAF